MSRLSCNFVYFGLNNLFLFSSLTSLRWRAIFSFQYVCAGTILFIYAKIIITHDKFWVRSGLFRSPIYQIPFWSAGSLSNAPTHCLECIIKRQPSAGSSLLKGIRDMGYYTWSLIGSAEMRIITCGKTESQGVSHWSNKWKLCATHFMTRVCGKCNLACAVNTLKHKYHQRNKSIKPQKAWSAGNQLATRLFANDARVGERKFRLGGCAWVNEWFVCLCVCVCVCVDGLELWVWHLLERA